MKTQILFVDDEENVLSGLRRMLRSQRNVWEMQFALGGQQALDMLQKQPFDVVVTDMRMPGIDGAELLNRISADYPNTVRLVLSGQSEHEKIFRAIGPAHQFMSKPCDSHVLVDTIERACGLQSQLQDPALKSLTSQIQCLPSLPNVYKQLVQELNSDDASLDRVAEIIGSDLGMTAKILQLVNSSFFGLPQHITCPKHAVSLLGLNIIQPLALSADAFSKYEDPNIDGFSLEDAVNHSLAVGTAAQAIARSQTQDKYILDDALIAGMMHDVGKIILAVNLPERYAEAIKISRNEHLPLWQAEAQVFGTTHAEVGAHLLGLWGIPNPIVEAVAFHHRPSACGNRSFSALTAVHAANVIQQADYPSDGSEVAFKLDEQYLSDLNLSAEAPKWQALLLQAAHA